jgi:surface polysaccharide O-acyltransferase-like enzyme
MERRFAEIDALKSIGILTVVLIHSVRAPFDPAVSTFEIWLGHLTRFAVPAFLISSGFLYAGVSATAAGTLRRLRRIGIPYLAASLIGQLFWAARGEQTETGHWASDLLFGSSMGPYYYVFVILGLVLVTPLFAMLGRRAQVGVLCLLVAAQWWVDAASGMLTSFFWHLRNPLLWWAYFATGWILRTAYDPVRSLLQSQRPLALAISVVLVAVLSALSGFAEARLIVRTAAWLNIYAICALIFVAACGSERVPTALRTLSDASYPIYLLHMFFVLTAVELFPLPPRSFALLPVLLTWAAGILGSISIIGALKAMLGNRSKDWIGA